jgi:hypothetical protein
VNMVLCHFLYVILIKQDAIVELSITRSLVDCFGPSTLFLFYFRKRIKKIR